jgi:formylglycine-generating enzyme required for sulfatase activity
MVRDQVFISYSHADSEWLNRLKTMLIPFQRQGTLKIWADTDIRPGQRWMEEIKQALAKAKVAVLLVSSDFLASRFVHEHELPPLLEAAGNEGLTIIWIPLRPCLYEETVIAKYQAAYNPETPLSTLPNWESALTKIARDIIKSTRLTTISESKPADQGTDALFDESVPVPTVVSKPPPQHAPPPFVEPKPFTSPARSTLPAIQNIHGWPAHQVQELQRQTALALGLAIEFRDRLKDGNQEPLMVVIPGGRFLMGSPTNEPGRDSDERQHEVEVAPFAIGKYAVTFEEYDHFAEAMGREKPNDEGWGRGRRPVINVSWFDAVAYTEWLSQQTGQIYRLPTEVEWEYTARAGTKTPFHFGTRITTDQANYDGNWVYSKGPKGIYLEKTVEVGQFSANAWSLYDMHGNVWEWTSSMYDADSYAVRGGAWDTEPRRLRSAARFIGVPSVGDRINGMRLARELPKRENHIL